jgi:hypothetical protein
MTEMKNEEPCRTSSQLELGYGIGSSFFISKVPIELRNGEPACRVFPFPIAAARLI